MRRLLLILVLLGTLVQGSVATTTAAPIITTTVSQGVQVAGPLLYFQQCRPELGQYTITLDLTTVSHVTASGIDESEPGEPGELIPPYHTSYATTGTITAVPETIGEPVFTGHIGVRQVEQEFGAGQVITSTTRTVLHGSDGSKVTTHSNFHVTVGPTGKLIVNFGETECST